MTQHGPVQALSEMELRQLTTPRLLAYQARLRRLVDGPSFSTDGEWRESGLTDDSLVICKNDPAYARLRALIRTILSERGHVPRTHAAELFAPYRDSRPSVRNADDEERPRRRRRKSSAR